MSNRPSLSGDDIKPRRNTSFSSYQLFALITNVFSIIILLVLFAVLEKVLTPFKRGFFCDDKSIQKPYMKQTVSAVVAAIVTLVVIFVAVVPCDCVNQWKTPAQEMHSNTAKKIKMRQWIYVMIIRFFIALVGLAFTMVFVGIGKVMFGRLRPHFLAVCQPQNCTGGFLSFDACAPTDLKAFKEATKSFPSGHAACSGYSGVFFALYLEYAMRPKHLLLLKPLLQFGVLFGEFAIGFTRVSDYFHHWSDVLAGILIGTFFAFYTIFKLMNLPHQLKHLAQDAYDGQAINDSEFKPICGNSEVTTYNACEDKPNE